MADHSYPFPPDEIHRNRFHGLLQGTFEANDDDRLTLRMSHGLVRLYPRQKKDSSPFYAARRQLQNHPDAVVNLYGYPRTNKKGIIDSLELCSWFAEGSPTPHGYKGCGRSFNPGQFYLCGRVKRTQDGLVTVKVKSEHTQKPMQWWVTGQLAGKPPAVGSKTLFVGGLAATGQLILRPLEMITPPGVKTRPAGKPSPSPVVRRGPGAAAARSDGPSASSSRPPAVQALRRVPERLAPASAAAASGKSAQPSPRQNPPEQRTESRPDPARRPAALQRPQRQRSDP